MKSLPKILTFVDVETTGTNPKSDRIIEIGILRVEGGKIVGELNSLVNPGGAYIPPFISDMTGISAGQLSTAPSIYDLKPQVMDLLSDSVFVAHNVNFDYGFVKHELKRLETSFNAKTLCTVRLARSLFPELGRFNLDNLVAHFGLKMENRHRAYDDAYALWDFYQIASGLHKPKVFFEAVKSQLTFTVPKGLKKADIDILPDTPGVYIFYKDDVVLYVGKSVNIKKRVMNHFTSAKFSNKEDRMFNEINRIETVQTHGELGALVRESDMVKKMGPIFNAVLRRKTEMLALVRDNQNGYFTANLVKLTELNESNMGTIICVYKSKANATLMLRDLTKEYKLCPKLLGLEKGKGRCFNCQLDLCNGACVGEEATFKYNVRFLEAFASTLVPEWPFEGEILIKEQNDEGVEIHKVNNWVYKGSVIFDLNDTEIEGLSETIFDWDIYKIIKRAVKKNEVITKKSGLDGQLDLF